MCSSISCYANYALKPARLLMIDDIQLHSVGELARLLTEQPGFELALDLGKSLVFKKATADRAMPEWNEQPYVVRRSRLASR
jgi:hypothetical protein